MTALDTTTFIERQAYLRATAGAPVTFKVPVVPKWPVGTKINPISNLPYDSTIKQENEPFEDRVKICLVILKQASPLRPQSDTETTALGESTGMDIILDVAESDYHDIEAAQEMVVNNLTYDIREVKPFSLSGQLYRRLIYGEQR